MNAAVIVFPGSNREHDIVDAVVRSGGRKPVLVWHGERDLPKVDFIMLPGGFAYGDYLRTGAIAAHSPIMREVKKRADQGVPVLGVCNGFQILCESGLLPGILLRNASLKFICRNVGLKVESSGTLFTRRYNAGDVLSVPVAHGEGNYFADPKTLDTLEGEGRVAFRYCTPEGEVNEEGNANGSARNIAGILNAKKNVLGMMPHPENATDPRLGSISGKPLFDAIVEALA
ncbi:MAG: phosphoribosylformylglycinamidine synthase subunit PurQ [Alphaproteobacteria bacterium]|nr:phosphoribosylformylglycinamidine synthase subunit PurQ [Alphaproteobacteria bacterium]